MMTPTSELAQRLATKRADLHQMRVNQTYFELEVHLDRWRAASRLGRLSRHPVSPSARDFLTSALNGMFARATAQLVDLGEN